MKPREGIRAVAEDENGKSSPGGTIIETVAIIGKTKSSSSSDYHDVSMMLRKYSGYALAIQKPLELAFTAGTRYPSQLYPGNTTNVVFQKAVLGKKIYVPLGNHNTATVGKLSKTLKIAGKTLGVAAVGFGVYDMTQNGINMSNGLDTSMALLALSPTGIGQAIAGTYFLCNAISQATTGKDIGQHIQEKIDGE